MAESLLHDLETVAPVAERLENIDDLVRVVMREMSWAIEGMKGSALAFENAWRQIVIDVANGRTADLQAARSQLQNALEKRLALLTQTRALAEGFRRLGRADAPDPETLVPEIADMERLKSNVFDRWQTVEDLEELAARDYPLTTADLDQIGPHRRSTAAYYAEESKPF